MAPFSNNELLENDIFSFETPKMARRHSRCLSLRGPSLSYGDENSTVVMDSLRIMSVSPVPTFTSSCTMLPEEWEEKQQKFENRISDLERELVMLKFLLTYICF